MSLRENKAVLYPQHKQKCYCTSGNSCYCTGGRQSTEMLTPSSTHKFIKIRNKNNHMTKTHSFSSRNSSSLSNIPTLMTPILPAPTLRSTSSVETGLTERRELYERSKEMLHQIVDRGEWMSSELMMRCEPEYLKDDKIIKLQEFRLKNADECVSSYSRFSMNDTNNRLLSDLKEDTKEMYTINKRGLLQKLDSSNEFKKATKLPLAVIANPKIAAKDVLQQKLRTTKEKDKFLRKALCIPENSLALSYQKTY